MGAAPLPGAAPARGCQWRPNVDLDRVGPAIDAIGGAEEDRVGSFVGVGVLLVIGGAALLGDGGGAIAKGPEVRVFLGSEQLDFGQLDRNGSGGIGDAIDPQAVDVIRPRAGDRVGKGLVAAGENLVDLGIQGNPIGAAIVEPSGAQSAGSRSGESLAEVMV